MSCPLEEHLTHLACFGEPDPEYPWASARQLEGRSPFDAFVEAVRLAEGNNCRLRLWQQPCCSRVSK